MLNKQIMSTIWDKHNMLCKWQVVKLILNQHIVHGKIKDYPSGPTPDH